MMYLSGHLVAFLLFSSFGIPYPQSVDAKATLWPTDSPKLASSFSNAQGGNFSSSHTSRQDALLGIQQSDPITHDQHSCIRENHQMGKSGDTLFSSLTHGVDLERQAAIEGDETQIVTITLEPGQTVRASPQSLIYRTDGVEMRTSVPAGFGRRLLTDTPIFQVDYVNTNKDKVGRVALGKRLPSKILRLGLDEYGGKLVIRKGTMLLMSDPTKIQIGVKSTRGILEALFGGQGFFQQTIQGEGQILLSSGGTQIKVELTDDESIRIEPSTLLAYTPTVDYSVTKNSGWTNVLFGDESLYVTTLKGPGTVWLQGLNPKFFQKRTVRVESDNRHRKSTVEASTRKKTQ